MSEEKRSNSDPARSDQEKAPTPADEGPSGPEKTPHSSNISLKDILGDPNFPGDPDFPGEVVPCPTCGGAGAPDCPTCGGIGFVTSFKDTKPSIQGQREITCPTCDGLRRLESGEKCPTCGGAGVLLQDSG